jgi:ABC-type multidrug transport system fused ATPase/permease subunit
VVVLLSIVATTLDVLSPLLFRTLIDEAIPSRDTTLIIGTLFGMVFLPVLASGLGFLEGRQRSKVAISVTSTLRQQTFEHVLSTRIAYLGRFTSGELLHRITRGGGLVGDMFVGENLLPVIPRLIFLVGNVAAMFYASWRLGLVTLVAVPLLFLFGEAVKKRVEQLHHKLYGVLEAGESIVHESLAGLRTIRAVNGQPREVARWRLWNEQYWLTKLETDTFHSFWMNTLSLLITNLVLAIVLGFGAFEIIGNRLSLGGLVAFIVYAPRVLSALKELNRTHLSLSEVRVAAAKLDELFAMPLERSGGLLLPATTHSEMGVKVAFDDVSFRYGRGESGVSNLSFQINPGEFVGIVGPTGGGKSTIFDLLSGFIEPDSGRIQFDDVEMEQLSLVAIREATGVVFQDTFLWNASLLENLVYPRDVTQDGPDVHWAVRSAQLESFVAELPDGLQTKVGERGHTFSGGERQRVAIARAVLRNPRLLLLDEATSALDPITEEKLRNSLESLRKGRTMIVIAHRLATIARADRIVVIDKGQVVEQGPPSDLLKQHGLFYAFYQAQKLGQDPT